MTDETQRIFNLMQNSMQVISDSDVWRYFLRTAAWHFKYPFNDQVLIFAQKSEATACAGMDDWVNKTKRWVKKDASPIALVRENGNKYYLDYVFDISDTNSFGKREIKLWQYDNGNIKVNKTYGTHRANALKIIEDTLNLRDVRIFDYKENEEGKRIAVLNSKETTIAQQKQEAIKAAFDNITDFY